MTIRRAEAEAIRQDAISEYKQKVSKILRKFWFDHPILLCYLQPLLDELGLKGEKQ